MSDKIKRTIVCILCLMCMLTVSGCSVIDYLKSASKSTQPDEAGEIQNTDTDSTITVGVVELDTYNPLTTKSSTMRTMLGFMFEPLFDLDNSLKVINVLAKSYQASPDGKGIRITLKDSVLWHDGTPFTANDVVYTIKTIQNNETNYSHLLENVTGVSLSDNFTVNISFNRSVPDPAALLCFPIIKNGSFTENYRPIGTGAFYLDYDKLSVYSQYHGKTPELTTIKIKSIPDNDKFVSLFNASVVDIADSYLINMNEYTPRSNAQVHGFYSNEMVYVGFNAEDAVFKYPEARRSVSSVINRQEIVSHIFFSRATAVNYPVNPDFEFYPMNKGNLSKDNGTAEKLLKDEEWKKDEKGTYFYSDRLSLTYFSVQILVNADDKECLKTAAEISDSMADMGMRNTVTSCSESEFNARIQSGNYDMFIGRRTLLPNNDLYDIVSGDNIFNYSDTETDVLLSQIGMLTNVEDKRAVYEKFYEHIREQSPIAPICFTKKSLITSAKLKTGVAPSVAGMIRNISEWSVK